MQYPKIQTLWKRDPEQKFHIIEGAYACPEFEMIHRWLVTEKVDGTNIRIIRRPGETPEWIFGGRTDKAQIPTFLLEYFQTALPPERLSAVFDDPVPTVLFGEGYGARIQKGGELYRPDVAVMLFDVWVKGWWLKRADVKDIGERLGLWVAPDVGLMSTTEAVAFIKDAPRSIIAAEDRPFEGIVARSEPLLLFRNGHPLVWKLKVKDYAALRSA